MVRSLKLHGRLYRRVTAHKKALDWFVALGPTYGSHKPIYKEIHLGPEKVTVIAFNTNGVSVLAREIIGVPIADAVATLDPAARLQILDLEGWRPLNDHVLLGDHRVVVVDQNGELRYNGTPR